MAAVVFAWAVIATACAIGLAVTVHFLGDRCREADARSRDASTRTTADATHERERAEAIIAYERERHTREIERLTALHEAAVEKVLHMVAYGSPTKVPAVVKDEEPDAEARLLAGISADMVTIGGRRIQEEYKRIGQVVSIEECELEARSMLSGVSPQIPPERSGDYTPPRD